MNSPKVSILVPVYNVEKYIDRCLNSILAQTFADFECIIVNDGSTDNSGSICDEYAKKDSRIKITHLMQNEGQQKVRKLCIEYSRCDYIQFIDSDDWIEPNMIEILYQRAISENNDITVCDVYHEREGTIRIIKQDFSNLDKVELIRKFFKIEFKSFHWNKLTKRELYTKVIFPQYNRGEDKTTVIQNIHNAKKISYVNIPLYHHCYNELSITQDKKKYISGRIEQNRNWRVLVDFLKTNYKDLRIFEPELSNWANNLKQIYMLDKNLRNHKELFRLYPESKFFRKKMFKTIIKMLMPKNILNKLLIKT